MNKLTEEQLKKLQDLLGSIQKGQSQIGSLESQKHDLLHQVAELQKQFSDFQNELEKEYGSVTIDITDGSFKSIDESESLDKE
jgi:predicted  nucleic acid-binding Zn-ribbon protein